MIKILAKVCTSEHWGFNTYHGEMSLDAREKAIEEFGKDESKNILLASLKSGGLGLNLTMVRILSTVLMLDRLLTSHRLIQGNQGDQHRYVLLTLSVMYLLILCRPLVEQSSGATGVWPGLSHRSRIRDEDDASSRERYRGCEDAGD